MKVVLFKIYPKYQEPSKPPLSLKILSAMPNSCDILVLVPASKLPITLVAAERLMVRMPRSEGSILLRVTVRDICRERHSKAIRTEREYFVKNAARMAYADMKALHLPIGSGAVESAVRRVINLRLKDPCIFWGRDSAEALLMLRAYYKAGRWNLLKRMANPHLSLLPA